MLRTQVFDTRHGDRDDVHNIGILITDGESTKEESNVVHEASLLKQVQGCLQLIMAINGASLQFHHSKGSYIVRTCITFLYQAGVRMFGLGITNKVDFEELQAIASSPTDEHLFQTESIQDVNDLTDRLVWGLCNDAPTCEGDSCNEPGAGSESWRPFNHSKML